VYFSAISLSICTKLARSILMRNRNIVAEPNFRKSLSKSRILSPKTSYLSISTCKQQRFAAGRSINSDDASPRPLTSDQCVERPIAHNTETNSRIAKTNSQNWQEGTPRHVRHCAPVSRSKVKIISSRRLYVSSLPLLHSGNKMLYPCHYRRVGAYRVGRTRLPHSLMWAIGRKPITTVSPNLLSVKSLLLTLIY